MLTTIRRWLNPSSAPFKLHGVTMRIHGGFCQHVPGLMEVIGFQVSRVDNSPVGHSKGQDQRILIGNEDSSSILLLRELSEPPDLGYVTVSCDTRDLANFRMASGSSMNEMDILGSLTIYNAYFEGHEDAFLFWLKLSTQQLPAT